MPELALALALAIVVVVAVLVAAALPVGCAGGALEMRGAASFGPGCRRQPDNTRALPAVITKNTVLAFDFIPVPQSNESEF
jgi:hypothetical protein